MKLIKLTNYHYIIVDNSEIKVNDWFFNTVQGNIYCNNIPDYNVNKDYLKKITHSTQPLEQYVNIRTQEDRDNGMLPSVLMVKQDVVTPFSLLEVKELIGEVDVEKKAYEYAINDFDDYAFCGYVKGYNQALEDNKDKKYTEEDLRKMFVHGKQLGLTIAGAIRNGGDKPDKDEWFNESIQSLQPKTEWKVEFIDGKLKLK